MNPVDRVGDLFLAAADFPPENWEPFLRDQCPGDDALAAEVLAMLRSRSQAFAWFDALERDLPALAPAPVPKQEGQRLGPYRLLREIGHGGMGTVFLAERDDGQFSRRVALKVISGARFSARLTQRLLAERQILSHLDHPNIARLLDGGADDDGTPYFVMELVEGQTLLDFAARQALSVRQRLALFLQAGAAVDYAHRHLTVHRDLKPANILVNNDGTVKLLDFGIAKLLTPDPAAFAATTCLALTPEYAAPEQFTGGAITTLTDVWGLGLVLYELLTGKRAFRPKDRSASALEQAVLHADHPPPSAIAPAGTSLDADLDHVVARALAKEPERRYASVALLLADIERYLDGRPVLASGDSFAYRAGKFVRRHRLAVSLAVGSLFLFAAFSASLLVQSARLARERDKAQKVAALFVELFNVADPDYSRGAQVTAREVLDRGSEKIRTGLGTEEEVQAALMDVMARAYHKLGLYEQALPLVERPLQIRRRPGIPTSELADTIHRLGLLRHDQAQYGIAESHFREALTMRRQLLGDRHPDTAASLTCLGLALLRQGKLADSQPLFEQAASLERALVPLRPIPLAETLVGLGLLRLGKGDPNSAESLFREASQLQTQALGRESRLVAETLNNLAASVSQAGRYREAQTIARDALDISRRVLGAGHPRVATLENNLAVMLMSGGAERDAEPLLRSAIRARRAKLPPYHPDLAQSLGNLGLLLQESGRFDEAEAAHREALDIRRRSFGAKHVSIVQSLGSIGQLKQSRRQYAEAERYLRESFEMAGMAAGPSHPLTANCQQNLALLLAERHHPEAERHFREALAIRRRVLPAGHPHLAYTLGGLGSLLQATRRPSDAEPLLREAVEIRRRALPAGHPLLAEVEGEWGATLLALGRKEEGAKRLAAAIDALESQPAAAAAHRPQLARWKSLH